MVTSIKESWLVYGIPGKDIPLIPEGWKFEFSIDEFAFLISPEGKRYWLHWKGGRVWGYRAKKASFWDFIRTRGKLKWGDIFMDEKERVDPLMNALSKSIESLCRKDLSAQLKLTKGSR